MESRPDLSTVRLTLSTPSTEPTIREYSTTFGSSLRTMLSRMVGVARIRADTFHELKEDESRKANGESLLVAMLAGLSLGVGVVVGFGVSDISSIVGEVFTAVSLVVVTTALWAGVVFAIGTKIFKGDTDFLGFARPVFFSLTPGLFFFLAALSITREVVSALLLIWIVVINLFIVKREMKLSSVRSVLTVFIGAWVMIFALEVLAAF